jgi:hypothetical protein
MSGQNFSQRVGAVPTHEFLLLAEMSVDLENSLWNKIVGFFSRGAHYEWDTAAKRLAEYFYKLPVDEVPSYDKLKCQQWLKKRFFEAAWYEKYDLLEFMVKHAGLLPLAPGLSKDALRKTFNNVLESERSGYRFVGEELAPISNTVEVASVEQALAATRSLGLSGAEVHLNSSLKLLSLKPAPDYRNSVKESISAVESMVKLLSGNGSGGLSGALEELQKKIEIHGALKAAFVKLYGYTSDSDGIRHAILDSPSVGFDEAKYMLVACSAFVYYLASKELKPVAPSR